MKQFLNIFFICLILLFAAPLEASKIVGLIQVRDEEYFIEQCLKALSLYTDAIVVLDDGSRDKTRRILRKLAEKLSIEKVIKHKESSWQVRDERYNRQKLLDIGRQIGGTHFIFIDADEMFTSLCAQNGWLRHKILSLEKGQMLAFPMVNLWGSTDFYRDDEGYSPYKNYWKAIPCILCDDGVCNYNENPSWTSFGAIHIHRGPANRQCKAPVSIIEIPDINYGLIHFKSVNLKNILIKKVWYMCLEYMHVKKLPTDKQMAAAKEINNFYNVHEFNAKLLPGGSDIVLKLIPESWYKGYKFFDKDCFSHVQRLRKKEVESWFKEYGTDYFKEIDIWEIPWVQRLLEKSKQKKGGFYEEKVSS